MIEVIYLCPVSAIPHYTAVLRRFHAFGMLDFFPIHQIMDGISDMNFGLYHVTQLDSFDSIAFYTFLREVLECTDAPETNYGTAVLVVDENFIATPVIKLLEDHALPR